MKFYLLFPSLFLMLIYKQLQFYKPIKYNYRNCKLTIKAGEWIKRNNKDILPVTTVLYNDSNDTLKYASYSCIENEIGYLKDTTNFHIEGRPHDCTKNWPLTVVIPPHKKLTDVLGLIRKYSGNKSVNIQLTETLELVNADVFIEELKVTAASKNRQQLVDKFLMYERRNTHSYLSNILKVQ